MSDHPNDFKLDDLSGLITKTPKESSPQENLKEASLDLGSTQEPLIESALDLPFEDSTSKQDLNINEGSLHVTSDPIRMPSYQLYLKGNVTPSLRTQIMSLLKELDYTSLSESDFDLQFQSGSVLIPKLNEMSCVYLIQKLRASSLHIELSSELDPHQSLQQTSSTFSSPLSESHSSKPDTEIPLYPDHGPYQESQYQLIQTLQTSQTITRSSSEKTNERTFNDSLEHLRDELRMKAYFMGADAILHLNYQIIDLPLQSSYKLILTGQLIKRITS